MIITVLRQNLSGKRDVQFDRNIIEFDGETNFKLLHPVQDIFTFFRLQFKLKEKWFYEDFL